MLNWEGVPGTGEDRDEPRRSGAGGRPRAGSRRGRCPADPGHKTSAGTGRRRQGRQRRDGGEGRLDGGKESVSGRWWGVRANPETGGRGRMEEGWFPPAPRCPAPAPRKVAGGRAGTPESWHLGVPMAAGPGEHLPPGLCPHRASGRVLALPPKRSPESGGLTCCPAREGEEEEDGFARRRRSRRRGSGIPETIQSFCRRCVLPGRPEVGKTKEDSRQHLRRQDVPAANRALLGVGPRRSQARGRGSQLLGLLLRSKSRPVESSWVSTTGLRSPKTLSREEQGVGGLLGNPEPPSRRERQQVVLSWYVTGKPFPPPQNTDSPERGWKVPCFRSNQHFRARCCTRSTRFATQGCSSPSCSARRGSCPVGHRCPGGRAGPKPDTGATMPH